MCSPSCTLAKGSSHHGYMNLDGWDCMIRPSFECAQRLLKIKERFSHPKINVTIEWHFIPAQAFVYAVPPKNSSLVVMPDDSQSRNMMFALGPKRFLPIPNPNCIVWHVPFKIHISKSSINLKIILTHLLIFFQILQSTCVIRNINLRYCYLPCVLGANS